MKKISFDTFFKIFILLLSAYLLFILTKLVDNLENGRYQFSTSDETILDTKTGIIYYYRDGEKIKYNGGMLHRSDGKLEEEKFD